MRKAYKYRIYLTNGQRRILEQQLEECRWVYNETLALRKNAWEQEQRHVDWYETKRALPLLKDSRPSLTLVHSQVLQNVTERVELAFKAFFRRVKAGESEVGYPRFKCRGRYDSITYPQYGNGVRLDGERLILSKVGAVQVVLHRPLEGIPKTVTLTRSCTGKWYASVSCETEAKPLPPTDAVVGVDVGLASFATLSNGAEIENPFISMTVAKAEEAGRRIVLVNPRNTSKRCSSCGELVQKRLSDRTHACPHCGLVMGRDHNAALNILHRGLQSLRL